MREVSVHPDHAIVGYHKSILESAGIACFIRNETSSAPLGAAFLGAIQSHLFHPALCIVEDDRYEEALTLLREFTSAPQIEAADWACAKCGESVPAEFDLCWNCSCPRSGPSSESDAPPSLEDTEQR